MNGKSQYCFKMLFYKAPRWLGRGVALNPRNAKVALHKKQGWGDILLQKRLSQLHPNTVRRSLKCGAQVSVLALV